MSEKSNHIHGTKYRSDIDGLRAIAVISVVLFHAFPFRFRGGFTGVDVFFVISGFLISTIIFENLDKNKFSFLDFYVRRIKRIFPALALVLTTCLIFGWFSLFPEEYRDLGKHTLGGSGFVANLVYWSEAGYFDRTAELKPLLHLWSLGIEEQFYFIWPIILWLSWKKKFNLVVILGIVALASFAFNLAIVGKDGVAAFYSPLTRFWELLIGSGLAYFTLYKKETLQKFKIGNDHVTSFVGAGLLAASFAFVSKANLFPGWWALLPTLGSALVISAGPQALFNKYVLSNKFFVGVGLISYPLYLWHWPFLTFARLSVGDIPPSKMRIAMVALSFLFSFLTYKFIETPIRFGQQKRSTALVLSVVMILVSAFGLFIYGQGGLKNRISFEPKTAAVLFDDNPHMPWHHDECDKQFPQFSGISTCLLSKPSVPPDVVIVGDSHGVQYFKSLSAALPESSVMDISLFRCFPFSTKSLQERKGCHEMWTSTISFLKKQSSIKTIYLAGYYAYLSAGEFEKEADGWRIPGNLQDEDASEFEKYANEMLSELVNTQKNIILLLDIPDLDFSPKSCVQTDNRLFTYIRLSNQMQNKVGKCGVGRKDYEKRAAPFDFLMERIVQKYPSIKVFNPRNIFCDADFCWAMKDGVPLYWDSDHLTIEGADKVVTELIKQFPSQ